MDFDNNFYLIEVLVFFIENVVSFDFWVGDVFVLFLSNSSENVVFVISYSGFVFLVIVYSSQFLLVIMYSNVIVVMISSNYRVFLDLVVSQFLKDDSKFELDKVGRFVSRFKSIKEKKKIILYIRGEILEELNYVVDFGGLLSKIINIVEEISKIEIYIVKFVLLGIFINSNVVFFC